MICAIHIYKLVVCLNTNGRWACPVRLHMMYFTSQLDTIVHYLTRFARSLIIEHFTINIIYLPKLSDWNTSGIDMKAKKLSWMESKVVPAAIKALAGVSFTQKKLKLVSHLITCHVNSLYFVYRVFECPGKLFATQQ